jgi:Spy/CpxP family protein refolding chaperone
MSFGIDASSLLSSQYSDSTTGGTTGIRQFANLNLTEEQRTQMRSILQNAKSQGTSLADVQQQLEQVLTPDQQAQRKAAQTAQPAEQTPALFANLNLTADQKTKIDAVLTDAQKTQLASNVQNARAAGSGRHHHHDGSGADGTGTASQVWTG